MPQFFIDRPIFAWVLAILITFVGILSIQFMPVSQYPNVAPPAITITAQYPGASAQEVAESVTSIIENKLNGAKGLLYYESVSDSNGQAQIVVTFAPGTDPDLAQVDVQNRVSNVAAQLPAAVNQQGLQFLQTSTGFLMIVTVSSKDGADGPDGPDGLHHPQHPEPSLTRSRCGASFSYSVHHARCESGSILTSWWD